MNEDLLSLAFAIHRNPGGYALLIGSGVSSGAGMPTGWGVTLDLARQLAEVEGAEEEEDLAAWYSENTGRALDYSDVVERLARTPDERRNLLKGYFEPTAEERERGLKSPSAAHRAIAGLVASGHVRVIITTNFDRLIEDALREAGITPVVVSSADGAIGAPPVAQSRALVVKVHGDYVDARIKNTSEELDSYEPSMDALLDRILDEFGLVICGWSAQWDPALRRALERAASRRFSWYWGHRGPLDTEAERLVALRGCVTLDVETADEFFSDLGRKVFSLDRVSRAMPLAASAITAEVKALIAGRDKIGLHDVVLAAQEDLVRRMSSSRYGLMREFTDEELLRSVEQYEADAELVVATMIAGCRWSEGASKMWVQLLERLGNLSRGEGSLREIWSHLTRYPAMQVLYGGGMAAIAGENWPLLNALLTQPCEYDLGERRAPLILHLDSSAVLQRDAARKLPGCERLKTPLNDHIFNLLRDPLRGLLPADRDYDSAFDLFEYLMVTSSFAARESAGRGGWIPPARLLWKQDYGSGNRVLTRMDPATGAEGRAQALLDAGLFGGSADVWATAHAAAVKMASEYFF